MTGDNRLSKVDILIQQKKYPEAETILKDLLSAEPHSVPFLALLAEVNLQQDQFDRARSIIDQAIGRSPDSSHLFYIKARIAVQQDNYDEAEKNLYNAIELDPYDATYFALLATIKLSRKQFEEALDLANEALQIDAENLLALNTRSTALNKLNKKEESFQAIEGALREDPNNAYTHANFGWGLLENGDHKKALEHFREALKNQPDFDYAQVGMVEAMKAGNPFYRAFLKYSFWMGNLTSKYQWGVIIGLYIGVKIVTSIARSNEKLQPYLFPLIIALAILIFSTWVVSPISNLFLRFNKFGNLLLDRKEKISSNLVAVSLGVFVLGVLSYLFLSDEKFLSIAVFGFAMMVPLGTMFSPTKYKHSLLIYTAAMAFVGVGAIALTFYSGDLFNVMAVVFVLGFVGFQWVANFLLIKENNR